MPIKPIASSISISFIKSSNHRRIMRVLFQDFNCFWKFFSKVPIGKIFHHGTHDVTIDRILLLECLFPASWDAFVFFDVVLIKSMFVAGVLQLRVITSKKPEHAKWALCQARSGFDADLLARKSLTRTQVRCKQHTEGALIF